MAGARPHRAKWPTRIARPSDGSKGRKQFHTKSAGGNRTTILYLNPEPIGGKCVDIIRQRRHDVVTASSSVEALAMMRGQIFDALVMDCVQDTLEILNFTAKAQGLQPSLAVFFADEWGDELATGLEELAPASLPLGFELIHRSHQ